MTFPRCTLLLVDERAGEWRLTYFEYLGTKPVEAGPS